MKYAQIRELDISNGENIGIALFTQGCPEPHCENCFNPETWDFNAGKEWTKDIENKFLSLLDRSYVKRCSFLGGEPLSSQNLLSLYSLIQRIKAARPDVKIWIYSRYTFEYIQKVEEREKQFPACPSRIKVISLCDVLVDGRYVESKRDLSLKFRGSSNQRVIDVQRSLKEGKVILWTD